LNDEIKNNSMSTIQLKAQIHKYIDSLQDENLVQAIYAMLDTYITKQNKAVVGYDLNGNPQYAADMKKQYKKGLEAVERGEGKTLAEVVAKYKNE